MFFQTVEKAKIQIQCLSRFWLKFQSALEVRLGLHRVISRIEKKLAVNTECVIYGPQLNGSKELCFRSILFIRPPVHKGKVNAAPEKIGLCGNAASQ